MRITLNKNAQTAEHLQPTIRIKLSSNSEKNKRLILYLQLCNLRQVGGEKYRELPEYKLLARQLFQTLNGYVPKDDS